MNSDGRANVTISEMFELLSFIDSNCKANVTISEMFYIIIELHGLRWQSKNYDK